MSEDQNTSGNSERQERPSSGWQSAAGRGQSSRDGGHNRREGGRRWEDRGERRDNSRDDRREGGFRGQRDDRPRFNNDRREDSRGGYGDRREGRRDFNDRPRFNNDRRDDSRGGRDDRPRFNNDRRDDSRGGRDDRRDDRRDSGYRRDPFVPEEITPDLLDKDSRSRLMSLSKVNAEQVARHLVYAGTMMDEDAELAYEHAQAAYRHAARIDIVREALGLAAYLTGRYSEALRELRTYRRMTDDYTHVAIEADSERGLGRPEKALAFIAEIPMKKLGRESQVELALVTSGARADAGDSEGGLSVLEKINPESLEEELRARFELIRADRLEELGRVDEATDIRSTWEPIFTAEGEVDLYEDEDDEDDDEFATDDLDASEGEVDLYEDEDDEDVEDNVDDTAPEAAPAKSIYSDAEDEDDEDVDEFASDDEFAAEGDYADDEDEDDDLLADSDDDDDSEPTEDLTDDAASEPYEASDADERESDND